MASFHSLELWDTICSNTIISPLPLTSHACICAHTLFLLCIFQLCTISRLSMSVNAGKRRSAWSNPTPILTICKTFSQFKTSFFMNFWLPTNLSGDAGLKLILNHLLNDNLDVKVFLAAEAYDVPLWFPSLLLNCVLFHTNGRLTFFHPAIMSQQSDQAALVSYLRLALLLISNGVWICMCPDMHVMEIKNSIPCKHCLISEQ